MGRTIIVGDVHGCADELNDLLAQVAFSSDDRLICVGDLVVRGPKPAAVMALVRQLGGRSVRGNHEHRLLHYQRASDQHRKRKNTVATAPQRKPSKWLKTTAKALTPADWAYLNAMPLWLDLPSHQVRVVHAGVVPGVDIQQQRPHTLMFVRCIDEHGQPSALRDGGQLWGALYAGPPHVVFGHNASSLPQLHPWATGLDTGCVYGGRLTAMVLLTGQPPPPLSLREDCLASVPARRTYVPIG